MASLVYFEPDTLPAFVIEKLPVRFEALWMFSLTVHVACAVVCLPACLFLITKFVQRRRVLHRWLGRATGLLVIAGLVPTGLILSLEAKGGVWVSAGFMVSALIVLWGMCYGVVSARRGLLLEHARAMRHVVAQMSVAVTSRAMLVGFDVLGMHPEVAYVVALWVPVVLSAAIAEGSGVWERAAALLIQTKVARRSL